MRFDSSFYQQDILDVAPELVGAVLVRKFDDGSIGRHTIVDIEIYRGVEDLACHASKGKTIRNSVMFEQGGLVYVYFIYGIHWMLNVVTGNRNDPQAILIRGVHDCEGPARLAKKLAINGAFYGEDLTSSQRLWIEPSSHMNYQVAPRIGVYYAGGYWQNMPWRYFVGSGAALTLPRKNS